MYIIKEEVLDTSLLVTATARWVVTKLTYRFLEDRPRFAGLRVVFLFLEVIFLNPNVITSLAIVFAISMNHYLLLEMKKKLQAIFSENEGKELTISNGNESNEEISYAIVAFKNWKQVEGLDDKKVAYTTVSPETRQILKGPFARVGPFRNKINSKVCVEVTYLIQNTIY
ncbi:hypothetical protein IC3_04903 [Bacillus cereus VD142]|nr:hypothetical protein IC3_04903 [Bacillus cereus VD142]